MIANVQKQTKCPIRIKQYITDEKGDKVGAIIDMSELGRINKVLKLIPPEESWLFENPDALERIGEGLSDVASGRVSKLDLKNL